MDRKLDFVNDLEQEVEKLTEENEKLIMEVSLLELEINEHKLVVDFIIRRLSNDLMGLLGKDGQNNLKDVVDEEE